MIHQKVLPLIVKDTWNLQPSPRMRLPSLSGDSNQRGCFRCFPHGFAERMRHFLFFKPFFFFLEDFLSSQNVRNKPVTRSQPLKTRAFKGK